jgi:hypothetical protein
LRTQSDYIKKYFIIGEKMKRIILLLSVSLILINIFCSSNPVEINGNQKPVIFSLTVFPDTIGPADSAIVICNAMDPDGDTLVYDWITDSRLRIKGVIPFWETRLFNTFENSRIFYPNQDIFPFDTVWVQCFARDRKGKSDAQLIIFAIKNDSL